MATEKLGLEVAVAGFRRFMSQMKGMDGAIGDTGKKWISLGDVAGGAGKVLAGVAAVGLAAVAAGAVAAVAAIGGLAVGLGKLAIEAAPLEGIGTAFDIMSEKAGLSLESLQTASAGTIADFELMRMANIALTGAGENLGTAFGEDLPKLMEIARASARATGQDVGFMFNSLVTGVKRTSPMLIDNTGLQLKLGEANQALADQLGKTVEELTGEERQIALLNATILAGEQMVADFGGGQATAAEQIAQFKTEIQNTKDQIGLAFLPALQAIMAPLGELASEVGPLVIAWAQEAGEWLGVNLPVAIDALRSWWVKTWPVIQSTVKEIWAFIQPIFKAIAEWLQDDGPSALDDLRRSWAETWSRVQAVARSAVSAIQSVIGPFLDNLQHWWRHHGDSVMTIVNFLWSGIQTITSTVASAISRLLETTISLWQSLWSSHGDAIMNLITTYWESVKAIWAAAFSALGSILDAFAAAIEGDWTVFGEHLRTAWDTIWAAIKTALVNTGQALTTLVVSIVQSIVDTFTSIDWLALGRSIIDGITTGVLGAISGLIDAVRKAIADAAAAARAAAGSFSPSRVFYEIGIDLVTGLIEGIQAKAGDAQTVIAGLFGVGGILGGFGATAAARWLAPQKESVRALEKSVKFHEAILKQEDLTHEHRVLHTRFLMEAKSYLAKEQNKLNKMEKEALALEKQRQDLAFLQKQAKLLDLIKEHGLDAGAILGGIEMGIDADVGAIVQAMTAAMQAIVEQAEAELGISSPSRIFAAIGAQMMAGLETGIASMVPVIQTQMQMAVQPLALPGRSASPVTTSNEYHYHLTTPSVMRDGGLRMEFQAMEMATR